MSKLEVEWDYDTDADQINESYKMLKKDLFAAVDFFVKENPLNLVENTNIWGGKNAWSVVYPSIYAVYCSTDWKGRDLSLFLFGPRRNKTVKICKDEASTVKFDWLDRKREDEILFANIILELLSN